jgi:hypothetical protein
MRIRRGDIQCLQWVGKRPCSVASLACMFFDLVAEKSPKVWFWRQAGEGRTSARAE